MTLISPHSPSIVKIIKVNIWYIYPSSLAFYGFYAYWEKKKKQVNQAILKEFNPEYSLERLMLKLQYFGHLMQRAHSMEKTLMLGKIEGRRRRGRPMVEWHHRLNGHEFEQALGDSEGQGSPGCCSPWGCRVRHDCTT